MRTALALVLATLGCSPTSHVQGAVEVEHPAEANGMVAGRCTTRDGRRVSAPVARYFPGVVRNRPLLYEATRNGRAMRFSNTWRDDRGTHFFAWVDGGPGYHYVFPTDADAPATRDVLGPGYRVRRRHRSYQPEGVTLIRCELRPMTGNEWFGPPS
ncbi:MAG: hypothetical protein JJ863_01920 [Deltaproteobacteria bacterium]|nr:hypothetical protein [Deltaproteobacteria bacterium]